MLPGQTDDLHIPCQIFRLIGPMVHVHGKRAQTGIAADLCSGCFRPPLVLVEGWWVEDGGGGGVTFRGFGAVERWHQGVCFARAACGRQAASPPPPFQASPRSDLHYHIPPLSLMHLHSRCPFRHFSIKRGNRYVEAKHEPKIIFPAPCPTNTLVQVSTHQDPL